MALRLAEAILNRLTIRPFLQELGKAWVQAAQRTVPVNSGVLRDSISFQITGPTSGELTMIFYGQIVAYGMPQLSTQPRAIRARARYSARVNRLVVHPNDFIMRAWESAEVKNVLARAPQYLVSRS